MVCWLYQMPLFPVKSKNSLILVKGKGTSKQFQALHIYMTVV